MGLPLLKVLKDPFPLWNTKTSAAKKSSKEWRESEKLSKY